MSMQARIIEGKRQWVNQSAHESTVPRPDYAAVIMAVEMGRTDPSAHQASPRTLLADSECPIDVNLRFDRWFPA